MKKIIILKSLIILYLLIQSTAFVSANDTLYTNITISGTINGEPIVGSGNAKADLTTGVGYITISFDSIPKDYMPICYGKSWKTKHHPNLAHEELGAMSLRTLSPEGYDFTTTMIYENGDTIISTGQLRRIGQNIDEYSLNLNGRYTGPENCVDILPASATLRSISPGVVRVDDIETIVLSDGSGVVLSETETFILLNKEALLPFPEALLVRTDSVGWDAVKSTLHLKTTAMVTPIRALSKVTK